MGITEDGKDLLAVCLDFAANKIYLDINKIILTGGTGGQEVIERHVPGVNYYGPACIQDPVGGMPMCHSGENGGGSWIPASSMYGTGRAAWQLGDNLGSAPKNHTPSVLPHIPRPCWKRTSGGAGGNLSAGSFSVWGDYEGTPLVEVLRIKVPNYFGATSASIYANNNILFWQGTITPPSAGQNRESIIEVIVSGVPQTFKIVADDVDPLHDKTPLLHHGPNFQYADRQSVTAWSAPAVPAAISPTSETVGYGDL